MIDIVIPNQDHEQFVNMAKKLGFNKLIFFGKSKKKTLETYSCDWKGKHDLLCANENIRQVVEKKKVDFIFECEKEPRSDFIHQRNSGLNHIICRFAKENNIAVAFSFSSLLNLRTRAKIMGRMAQNIKLCRKYGLKMIIAPFADEPYKMRAPSDLISLFVTLGMQKSQAKDALTHAYKLIAEKKHNDGHLLANGVEIVK